MVLQHSRHKIQSREEIISDGRSRIGNQLVCFHSNDFFVLHSNPAIYKPFDSTLVNGNLILNIVDVVCRVHVVRRCFNFY